MMFDIYTAPSEVSKERSTATRITRLDSLLHLVPRLLFVPHRRRVSAMLRSLRQAPFEPTARRRAAGGSAQAPQRRCRRARREPP